MIDPTDASSTPPIAASTSFDVEHIILPVDEPIVRDPAPKPSSIFKSRPSAGSERSLVPDKAPTNIFNDYTDSDRDDDVVASDVDAGLGVDIDSGVDTDSGVDADPDSAADDIDLIKVSARSRSSSVAGAIAGVIRQNMSAEVQAIGAGAVNQSVKALAIARGYLEEDGIGIVCVPYFTEVTIDDQERTALRFQVHANRITDS